MFTQPTIEQCYAKIEWTLTNKKAGGQRAQKLFDLCEKYQVNLDDVKIEQHNDYRWGETACNRFQIGGTNNTSNGRAIDKFWAILPIDAVRRIEYVREQKSFADKIKSLWADIQDYMETADWLNNR